MSRSHDHPRVIAAALVVVFCCWGAPVLAQTALGGVVSDASGYIIQNAEVIVVNVVTGQEWRRTTGPLGDYIVWDLPPGRYRVRMEPPPYKAESDEVEVIWGFQAAADLMVYPTTAEAITVKSEPLPADTIATDPLTGARIFSRKVLETMALSNGRTMQSAQSAVPGIIFTEWTGSMAQFTAVGQRRFSNRMTIDGISTDLAVDIAVRGVTDGPEVGTATLPAYATSGGTQTLVPLAAIEEIEVRTTNTSAEHARTPGAQTVIVTRAGSDRFTGAAFAQTRPSHLAASDSFDNSEGPGRRRVDYWETGALVGGPLYRNRLFSFATWERQRINRPYSWTVRVPSLQARESASAELRPFLDAFPLPNGPETGDHLAEFSHPFPISSRLSTLSARLDASPNSRQRIFARINHGRSNGDSLAGAEAQPFVSFSNMETAETTTGTIGWSSNWSTVSHDVRTNVSVNRAGLTASSAPYGGAQPLPWRQLVPPGTSEADAWVNFGLFFDDGGFLLSGRTGQGSQRQLQVVDTWTFQRGRHEWRAGLDYQRIDVENDGARKRYIYRFNDVSQLLDGQVSFVNVYRSDSSRARVERVSLFAQDTFRVSPRLSFNYGFRYRVEPAPVSLVDAQPWLMRLETLSSTHAERRAIGSRLWRTRWTDVAPHLGASYQLVTESGRETTLRAGWNMTFDELASAGLRAFNGYPYAWAGFVRPRAFPAEPEELDVAVPQSFEEAIGAEAIAFPEDLRSPRTFAWHLGVERALGRSQRIDVAYVGTAGRDLLYWYSHNVNNTTHTVHAFSNHGTSDYNAAIIEYVRSLSRGLEGRVSYTWSHAIDVDSGETQAPNPPPTVIPVSSNRGSADFDRRHVLRAAASYRIPGQLPRAFQSWLAEWQIDLVATVTSGAPVSVTRDRVLDFGIYRLRPDVVDGVPIWIDDPASATGRRINPDAFMPVTDRRQGTLGRNTLRAATLRQVDVAVSRAVQLGGRLRAQFRLEAFNVFNLQTPGPPISRLELGDFFGKPLWSYANALGTGTLTNGGLVPLQQVGSPRSVQIAVRFDWSR